MCDQFFVGEVLVDFQALSQNVFPLFFFRSKMSSTDADQKGGVSEVPAAGAFAKAYSSCESGSGAFRGEVPRPSDVEAASASGGRSDFSSGGPARRPKEDGRPDVFMSIQGSYEEEGGRSVAEQVQLVTCVPIRGCCEEDGAGVLDQAG